MPAVLFAQTNYYAAAGTNYSVIGSLPGDQIYPDIALNSQGGYVVWQDNITDPVGEGISAMQLDRTLSGSGNVFQVNVTTTNDQQNARVALLKGGGAVFVWQGGPGNMQHIYARFLDASNLWLSTTNVLVSTDVNTFQAAPAVATLTNGDVVVVWDSFDQAGSSSLYDVYGQMFSSNGLPLGGNFLVNVVTTYNQRDPAIAALQNGGFVVAWSSETNVPSISTNAVTYSGSSGPTTSIYERLFSVSGTSPIPTTGEIPVNEDANPCSSPAIAVAADGSYMVTWCANNLTNSSSSWDVYERSFTNSAGGSVNLVNSYTYGDQYNPRISVIGGDYLIVFTSLGQDGSREGVYGQFIHEGDGQVGGEFRVNAATMGQQMEPAVTSDGSEQFLAVWTSFTFGPNSFDLYAQAYANVGTVLQPMAAPFVWAPFVVTNGVYQPQLVVSWAPVTSLAVSNYEVFVDGQGSPMAVTTNNVWVMTAANGLQPATTHSFALEYVTAAGFNSPLSPTNSAKTWLGYYWGSPPNAIPVEWMSYYYGGDQSKWPAANAPLVPGGPTLWQVFLTGGNPTDSTTWLRSSLTKTDKGMYLIWTTQPGMTYQVQSTTNFATWTDVGGPRFASGTNYQIFVGTGPTAFYRVELLRQ